MTVQVGHDLFHAEVPAGQTEHVFPNVTLHAGEQTIDVKIVEGKLERGPKMVYITQKPQESSAP